MTACPALSAARRVRSLHYARRAVDAVQRLLGDRWFGDRYRRARDCCCGRCDPWPIPCACVRAAPLRPAVMLGLLAAPRSARLIGHWQTERPSADDMSTPEDPNTGWQRPQPPPPPQSATWHIRHRRASSNYISSPIQVRFRCRDRPTARRRGAGTRHLGFVVCPRICSDRGSRALDTRPAGDRPVTGHAGRTRQRRRRHRARLDRHRLLRAFSSLLIVRSRPSTRLGVRRGLGLPSPPVLLTKHKGPHRNGHS